MNELTTAKGQSLTAPAPMGEKFHRAVSYFRSNLITEDGQTRFATCAPPSNEQIGLFRSRAIELRAALSPAGEDSVRPHVVSVFASLHHRSEGAEDRERMIAIYAADLADLPVWAVDRACADFRKGRAGDGKWCPTQAEIRRVAEGYTRGPKDELVTLKRIGAAARNYVAPAGKGDRAAALDRWETIKAEIQAATNAVDMRSIDKSYSTLTPKEAQANLDRMLADPAPAPKLSDEALAIFMRETLR